MDERFKVDNLNLSKYYKDMRKNAELLHEKNPPFYDENGIYVDPFNPDCYSIRLYSIIYNDILYVGNEQIPYSDEHDNKEKTFNLIDYWFRGNNCNFKILYEYQKVHNKSINYKGYGCNQDILNIIKKIIVKEINANLNINNVGVLDKETNNIKSWYGKKISIYKQSLRKTLKNMTIEDMSKYILMIIEDIENNNIKWGNMLYFNNRYWLISDIKEDVDDRNAFFSEYDHIDDKYIAILVFFKEYLLGELIKKLNGYYYKSIFSKKEYIRNPKCKYLDLFRSKNLFTHKKPIEFILSMCYKEVYEGALNNQYKQYLSFKEKLYKNIYSK